VRTDRAQQALADQGVDAVGHGQVVQPQTAQAGKGADGRVGVQGGQHEMAGGGGVQCCFGCFFVPDFADQDHVRVVAQEGRHGFGKIVSRGQVDLGLAGQGDQILDGVFHGEHVFAQKVQRGQTGHQGRGLARPGGAGEQDDAERFIKNLVHPVHVLLEKTQHVQA